jgi:transposase-like protein/ribosomal protein L37AE/L43A
MIALIWHNLHKPFQGDIVMPKNKIQFQKGLSLHRFQELYGTEIQCREKLFRAKWPGGYRCPQCGHDRYYQLTTRALYQCCQCRHQSSLASGTIFAASKLPLTIWFLAIFLITQSKEGMSTLNLRRFLGISDNAALRMKHKLQLVMKNADDAMPLNGLVMIDDVYWGGKKQGCKRGRGAAGKTPFVAALSRNEEGHPIHIRFSRVAGFRSEEIIRWSSKHLCPSRVVFSDGLACFRSFEKTGHYHWAIKTGGGKDPGAMKPFRWLNIIIGNIKNSIRGTYHGISHKHLPRYLAEFCYRFNRRFDLASMVGNLIYFAAQSKPIPQQELKLAEDWW